MFQTRSRQTDSDNPQLLQNHSSRPTRSDAIPGGSSLGTTQGNYLVPVDELVGIRLPPSAVITVLLDTYIKSCHWYITLFHEPTFRTQLAPILRTGEAHVSQKPFLLFLFALLLSGSKFCHDETIHSLCPGYDYRAAQQSWMTVIEQNLLSCSDKITLHHLGLMFLLSTLYFNGQKTALAFSIVGMLARAAQAIDLHKEPSWGRIDPIERHVRRLVWWSIYMTDG